MMTVSMENASATTPREIAQCLYSKNVLLEKKLRKSVHSKIPSDPIRWREMRQNYEAVLLTDSEFSESHDVEHALWQLHYRCIEEFRARLRTSSLASSRAVQANGGEAYVRRESKTEILSSFKSFLTEATGFYHDLILKIKAKHGLPLDHLCDSVDDEVAVSKDDKRSIDKKKGLMSCHRCLIYLGDLARYTELYGEGDLSNRNYVVASSYYTQAASMCPRSGNPHHQLAVLASYMSEEMMIIYRYFRSLAVQSPCSTARDNLIILFEKNRGSYSQLPLDSKSSGVKMVNARASGRGKGRGETRLLARDNKKGGTNYKEKAVGNYKNLCIRFVRLNGILFTRTSLETFEEVFSSVVKDLDALLSSGTEEELNFGLDITENMLTVVRLIAILIFTVHNVNKDSEGQSYAEILQRSVLLQNAFIAAFEFVGHIMQRCVQLKDISSSYLLPAVLIFLEWLACHLDVAAGVELEEKQAATRSFFWKQCISFLNKLIGDGYVPVDSTDSDACFYDSSTYDENEPGGRVALPEDFELRGFLPLQAAQLILDFSKKHSHVTCGDKAKACRVQRILAAGRALITLAQVDQEGAYFDQQLKRFAIGVEPQVSEEVIPRDLSDAAKSGNIYPITEDIQALRISASNGHMLTEVEEEDEVIVFKPAVAEKRAEVSSIKPFMDVDLLSAELSSKGGWGASLPPQETNKLDVRPSLAPGNIIEGPQQFSSAASGSWLLEPQKPLVHKVADLRAPGSGLQDGIGVSHQMAFPRPSSSENLISGQFVNQMKALEAVMPSMVPKLDSVMFPTANAVGLPSQLSSLPALPKKNPVSRPVRHVGPPPGFGPVGPKQPDEAKNELAGSDVPFLLDDYSWLDGYGLPSTKGIEQNGGVAQTNHNYGPSNNDWNALTAFPFPGKQLPSLQVEMANQRQQHPSQLLEQLKLLHGQQQPGKQLPSLQVEMANQREQHPSQLLEQLKLLHGQQQLQQNLLMNHNQSTPLPEQYTGSSPWSNRFLV